MERGGGVEARGKSEDVVISDLERSGETVRESLLSAGLRRQLPRWAAAIPRTPTNYQAAKIQVNRIWRLAGPVPEHLSAVEPQRLAEPECW
jgi:hypothetical protein